MISFYLAEIILNMNVNNVSCSLPGMISCLAVPFFQQHYAEGSALIFMASEECHNMPA